MAAEVAGYRGRSSLVALTAALLALVGCSTQGPAPAPTPQVLSEADVTCAQLTADPEGLGALMSTDRIDGLNGGAFFSTLHGDTYAAGPDGQPVALLDNGTRLDGYVAVFTYLCGSSSESLADKRAVWFADSQGPPCLEYLDVDKATRVNWITLAGILVGAPDVPAEWQVTAMCLADPEGLSLTQALTALASGEVPPTGPPPRDGVLWQTTSDLGYTTDSFLEISTLRTTGGPHPDAPGFEVGSACAYDPQTDALLPLTLMVTNTTPDYEAILISEFAVEPASSGHPETVSVSLVTYYNETVGCEDDTDGQVSTWVQWVTPAATGQTLEAPYFAILRDYFSPKYPDGNAADLGRLVAEGRAPVNTGGDPVTLTTPGAIHLDRTPVE